MSREIKFRAWDKELNSLLKITGFELSQGEINGVIHDGDFIGYDKEEIHLMQYTGLKDKNGAEIYEGDLLEDEEKQLWQVGFHEGSFVINNVFIPGTQWIYKGLLKVGNIYENPELLEVGK